MPIKIPSNLPAYDVLTREGVMVMDEDQAGRQDIRPLRIGLLNLMPKKIQTETQFARLIGATPLQIEFSLIRMTDHQTRNTAFDHMESFYRPFAEVAATGEKFDGLIITGAPIEHLPFDQVTYWDELKQVFDWTQIYLRARQECTYTFEIDSESTFDTICDFTHDRAGIFKCLKEAVPYCDTDSFFT